jgi:hypothetical protein
VLRNLFITIMAAMVLTASALAGTIPVKQLSSDVATKTYVDGEIAVLTTSDKSLTPTTTSGDASSTGITISSTPTHDSYVGVSINGQFVPVGDGVKTSIAYFSSDGGTTARDIADIEEGDTLYWNGTTHSWELSASDDRVDLHYCVAGSGASAGSGGSGLVEEVVVTTPTDTIDFEGLDFANERYYVDVEFTHPTSAGSGALSQYIFAGDPTLDETLTNYKVVRDLNNSNFTASAPQFASTDTVGHECYSRLDLTQMPSGRLFVVVTQIRDGAFLNQVQKSVSSSAFSGTITKLRFKTSKAGGWDTDARIAIYRK